MVMHARSGGNLEVMGLMLGKVDGETMIIMDSFALPVEGTETRVNAQAAAYEYMAAYIENAKQVKDAPQHLRGCHGSPCSLPVLLRWPICLVSALMWLGRCGRAP